MLVRHPGFALVAILTLALGIGANTAIFSVVNAVLLRPLAYRNPEQLLLINHNYPKINLKASVSAFGYRHYREHVKSFESIAALTGWPVNLTGGGEPERLAGMEVTANFFPLLGAESALGRVFTEGEDERGRDRVVVLSDAFWQRRFGGETGIVNQKIMLNGEGYTVVGIMPPSFQFGREFGQVVDLWKPIAFTPDQLSSNALTFEFLSVIARLKPGVTESQAQAEMDSIAAGLRTQYLAGLDAGSWGLTLQPMRELVIGEIRTMLWILLGAVLCVLLVACANVANLLLARAASRQKEMALRAALGAGRARIIRQLLTESLLVALAGGALGLVIGYWGLKLLLGINEGRIPRAHEIGLDFNVLGFTFVVAIATGLIFGIAPALAVSRGDLQETLKEGGRGAGTGVRRGLRGALVIAEVAIALVLLAGAGLLIKSFARLQQVNPGFQPDGLLTMQISLPDFKYPEPARRDAFFRELIARTRALPGVEAAGAVSILPLSGSNSSGSFQIEGRITPPGQMSPHGDRWSATADYFKTMKIPLVRGRYFEERDAAEAPGVAIIDETMAQKYWPGEDPVGRRISFEGGDNNRRWREIVGIVGHVRHRGLEGESRVQYYIPHPQRASANMNLVVRASGSDPAALSGTVREAVRGLDRDLPVFRVRTMDQFVADSMAQRRFALLLFGIFAAVSLLLAAIGLYGVLAYAVTQRTHEIGVRLALGARPRDVLAMVVRQGMTLAVIGVALGLGAAFALTRLLAALLFGVSARDPLVFASIAVLLALVALVACLVPARRATRVDPLVALRYE
jgi:putative ABC transport system permease protein